MRFFDLLGDFLPGEVTFNQVRILQYVHLSSGARGGSCHHRQIASELGIAPATVSRALVQWHKLGVIQDVQDPHDGRRRYVMISSDRNRTGLDEKIRRLTDIYFGATKD